MLAMVMDGANEPAGGQAAYRPKFKQSSAGRVQGRTRFHDLHTATASSHWRKGTPITTVAQVLGRASAHPGGSVMEAILQGAEAAC